MPLLFDQNISFRIIRETSTVFPGLKQVREVGLEGKKDLEIWKWAKENGFAIVTFDADFVDFSLLFNFPPKVIWLRLGNSSTKAIARQLIDRSEDILAFLSNDHEGILKIESGF
jgi:predicted nuclease of predicted toxin-antitoxin system